MVISLPILLPHRLPHGYLACARRNPGEPTRSPSEPTCVNLGGGVVGSPPAPLGPLIAATQEPQGVANIPQRDAVVGRGVERSFDVAPRPECGELVAQAWRDHVAEKPLVVSRSRLVAVPAVGDRLQVAADELAYPEISKILSHGRGQEVGEDALGGLSGAVDGEEAPPRSSIGGLAVGDCDLPHVGADLAY